MRELFKMRDYWRKLARRTGDPDARVEYRNLKREVKREIRQAERESIADQVKRNPKNYSYLWKTIRLCIPKKSTNQGSFSRDNKRVA